MMKLILFYVFAVVAPRAIIEVPLQRSVRMTNTDTDREYMNAAHKDQLFSNLPRLDYQHDQPIDILQHIERDNLRMSSWAVAEIFYQSSDGESKRVQIKADTKEILHERIKMMYEDMDMEWIEPEYPEHIHMRVSIEFDAKQYRFGLPFDPAEHNKKEEWEYDVHSKEEAEKLYRDFKQKFKNYYNDVCAKYNVAGRFSVNKTTKSTSKTVQTVSRVRAPHHHNAANSWRKSTPEQTPEQSQGQQLCQEKRASMEVKNKCIRAKKSLNITHMHQARCLTRCTLSFNNGIMEVSSVEVTAVLK